MLAEDKRAFRRMLTSVDHLSEAEIIASHFEEELVSDCENSVVSSF